MQARYTQPGPATTPRSNASNRTSEKPAPEKSAAEKPAPEKSAVQKPSVKAEEKAGKPVEFSLQMPQAKVVAIAGTFNGWDHKRSPMRRDGNGSWKASVPLSPGRYEYRFVADGQWLSDP